VHAGEGGRTRTPHQLEQTPLGACGLRVAREVGDHDVVDAVVLAGLRQARLDAHGVHAVVLPADLHDLARVVAVDEVLVKDLLPRALRDHPEHLGEHVDARLEDHHSAVILVLAAIPGHGDVPLGQVQFQQSLDPGAEDVGVRIHEDHPFEGQAEAINLLETVMPTPQEL